MSSSRSVLTVIGKDRIGIVYDVSKLLAEHQINILNISQQLMDDYFTMIILIDTAKCPQSREEMLEIFAQAGIWFHIQWFLFGVPFKI